MSSEQLLVATAIAAASVALFFISAQADPEILYDFILPVKVANNAEPFTFRGFKNPLNGWENDGSTAFKVAKASVVEFPVVEGQSVSTAVLQFAPGSVNAPHTHPRAAEFLIVLQGTLRVGFVDSSNKLFTQSLSRGEAFLFPEGLVHFQANLDGGNNPALAIAAFGSANPGTVSLPKTLFDTGIDSSILEKSFKIDAGTLNNLVQANRA